MYPSQPPHKRENCTTPIKYSKCNGPHHFSKCKAQLPQKFVSCGAEDHAARSMKCPKRPTSQFKEFPTSPYKKSKEIDKKNY